MMVMITFTIQLFEPLACLRAYVMITLLEEFIVNRT